MPGTVVAISATLLTLGVIVLIDGVCERFGAPSLWLLATRDKRGSVRFSLAAATAGLGNGIPWQWLGKLWTYPVFGALAKPHDKSNNHHLEPRSL